MRYILILLLAAVMNLSAGQFVKSYSDIGVEEYRLNSGLKVFFKKNTLDKGEVFVRIFSKGGYAQEESLREKVSAYVSFLALFESGFGLASSPDQVSKILYDNSTELSLYVLPSSKGIEAKIPTHHFDQLVEFIAGAFNHPKIKKTAFSHVIDSINESVDDLSEKNKYRVLEKMYEVQFKGTHFSSDMPGHAIDEADLSVAQDYVNKSFAEDEQFTIVVVGDINPIKAIESLEKHLPMREHKEKPFAVDVEKGFAKESMTCSMKGNRSKDAVSSVIYSLKLQPDGKELALFENSLRVIEKRLDAKLARVVGKKGIRVSFEFPYYPEASLSWVQIKFNAQPHQKQYVVAAIQKEMKDLIENGPSEDEFKQMVSAANNEGAYLKNDNYFWLSVLSDYALWGWDLNEASFRMEADASMTPKAMQEFLKKSVAVNTAVNMFLD